MQVSAPAIPKALTDLPQWVVWRLETTADGKPTKVPYTAARPYAKASTTNPATWDTYERARATADNPAFNLSGVGFVFTRADGFCGLDFDHCLKDGVVNEFIQSMLDRFDSYSEFSQSGEGIHTIIIAEPPRGRKTPTLECYAWGRFFCVTGDRVPGTPRAINERQEELDELFDSALLAEDEDATTAGDLNWDAPLTTDDHEVLRLVGTSSQGGKFRRLYDHGDTMGYGSGSEADLALCAILAFWTDNNPTQIDRMFRSSQLMRAKWDEKRGKDTYGEMTIAKAVSGTTDTYKGKGKRVREEAGAGPRFGTDPSAGTDSGPEPEVDPETGEIKEEKLFIWADELDDMPDPEWLIEDVLNRDSLAALVGPYGSAKTFVMLDMAACVSTGHHWHGRDVEPGYVVYVYAEGVRGIKKRVRAWEESNHQAVSKIAFVPRAIRFLEAEDVDYLIERINAEVPEQPMAIFIDTLARAMYGGNENDSTDMGTLIENADRLKRATGATVVFAHHTNKGGGYRGSTSLPGGLDTMIMVKKEKDIVELTCDKMKEAEQFEPIHLGLVAHANSLAVEHADQETFVSNKKAAIGKNALETLEALRSFGVEGTSYTEWFHKTKQQHKGTFDRHRVALHDAGMVSQTGDIWSVVSLVSLGLTSVSVRPVTSVSFQHPPLKGGLSETSETETVLQKLVSAMEDYEDKWE